MRIILKTLIYVGFIALGFSTPAQAHETGSSTPHSHEETPATTTPRDARAHRQAELKKNIAERKAEKVRALDTQAKQRVHKLVANMYNRLSHQIARLQKVDTTIATKIKEAETRGIQTTSLMPLYAAAQQALLQAKIDVEATKAFSLEQVSTSTSHQIIRDAVKKAETSIKKAGTSYKEVSKALKSLTNGTSTPTVSTSTASSTN